MPNDTEDAVTVRWYACDCPWTTKYCDEEHVARARVPRSVLEEYRINA